MLRLSMEGKKHIKVKFHPYEFSFDHIKSISILKKSLLFINKY